MTTGFGQRLDDITLGRARRGDLRACEVIYRRYERAAYSLAYRICRCPHHAQDILQDSFLLAFRRIRQYRGDAPFGAWLRRIVSNTAISHLRRQPAAAQVFEEERGERAVMPSANDEAMDLERALGRLSPSDRTVVLLHDLEGLNHKEIAALFEMTESWSKTRLSRARAQLRQWLEPPAAGATESAGPASITGR